MASTDDIHLVYRVEVKHPGGGPDSYDVDAKTSLGSSEDNDIAIQGEGLAAHHCFFRVQNEIISVHNLGPDTEIDGLELTPGKMYILDKGDKVQIGNVELIVRSEEQKGNKPKKAKKKSDDELDFEDEDEDEYEDDDATDPNANVEALLEKAEEDEVKKSKKEGGLLARLGFGKKKKNKVKAAGKKVKVVKHHKPIPAALPRMYALLAEFSLIYSLIYFVFPYLKIESPVSQYAGQISKLVLKFSPKITGIIPQIAPLLELFSKPSSNFDLLQFLIHFIAIHLVSHALFGTTLPLALMGVKDESSFVISRGKGLVRSLLGLVTTPLILLDLPLIIGKRSVKEVLTGTRLSFSSGVLKWFGALILLPVIVLSPIALPLLWNPEYLMEGITLEEFKKEKRYKGPGIEIETFSNKLGLGIKGSLPERFLIFPMLNFKDKKTLKGITFVDTKKKSSITLAYGGQILWPDLLKELAVGDPLFSMMSPSLGTMTSGKLANTILDKEGTTNFKKRLEDSLKLGLMSLVTYVPANGPFTSGSIKLRQKLLQRLSIIGKVSGRWTGLGKKELLILTASNGALLDFILLDVSFPKAHFYQATIKTKEAPLFSSMVKYFLASGIWKAPKESKMIGAGELIDLPFKNKKEKLPKVSEVVKYYKTQLVGVSKDSESFEAKLAKKHLTKYVKVLKMRIEQGATHLSPYLKVLGPLVGEKMAPAPKKKTKKKSKTKRKKNDKKSSKKNRKKRKSKKRK